MFGTKQSGDMTFKIANIKEDYKILVQANTDSLEFLNNTPVDCLKLRDELISAVRKYNVLEKE